MIRIIVLTLGALAILSAVLLTGGTAKADTPAMTFFPADNKNIDYTGRIDFSNPKKPRFWASGVYITARFEGTSCDIKVNDEVLWGNSHNYLEVAVDNFPPVRVQTTSAANIIRVAENLSSGAHTVTICKDTESGIGYLEFVGIQCANLLKPPAKPSRKLEFIGDSITCGTASDLSKFPCGQGQWYDQHNAYMSYGPATARNLHAQWQLTSASGIGLIHSCCDMKITMPDVVDKINLRENALPWDFHRYQPDAVTICLGQNDGEQDPVKFSDAYVAFIERLRGYYPKAQIVCLTSPMADAALTSYMKANLPVIVNRMHKAGDKKVSCYFFSRSYNNGCGGHPDMAQHQLIAAELSKYLKSLLHWQ